MARTVLIMTVAALVIVAVLAAWSPWLGPREAERRAAGAFTAAWRGVVDGCGLNCPGCGARVNERLLFGYSVTLEYGCGIQSITAPEPNRTEMVYVSPLGAVHGLRRP